MCNIPNQKPDSFGGLKQTLLKHLPVLKSQETTQTGLEEAGEKRAASIPEEDPKPDEGPSSDSRAARLSDALPTPSSGTSPSNSSNGPPPATTTATNASKHEGSKEIEKDQAAAHSPSRLDDPSKSHILGKRRADDGNDDDELQVKRLRQYDEYVHWSRVLDPQLKDPEFERTNPFFCDASAATYPPTDVNDAPIYIGSTSPGMLPNGTPETFSPDRVPQAPVFTYSHPLPSHSVPKKTNVVHPNAGAAGYPEGLVANSAVRHGMSSAHPVGVVHHQVILPDPDALAYGYPPAPPPSIPAVDPNSSLDAIPGLSPSPEHAKPSKKSKKDTARKVKGKGKAAPANPQGLLLRPAERAPLVDSNDPTRQRIIDAHRENDRRTHDIDKVTCMWVAEGAAEPCYVKCESTAALVTHFEEAHGVNAGHGDGDDKVVRCRWQGCTKVSKEGGLMRHIKTSPFHCRDGSRLKDAVAMGYKAAPANLA